jgi:hypothetical protein
MEADNAGFFLERLDAAAASGGEDFYRLASTIGGRAHFEGNASVSYTRFLAGNVANGATLPVAHLLAKQAMQAASNGQQQAWLDSNSDDTSDKFDISRILHYSLGTGILLAGDDPVISSAGVEGFDATAPGMSLTLWASNITTTGTLAEVWALVTPPDTDGFGGTDPVPVKVLLAHNGTRYEGTYSQGSPLDGTYTISFYASDTEGAVSLPWTETLARVDAYEVDDTEAQANAIIVDDPAQYHSFHTIADEDWVTFAAADGDSLTITADPVGAEVDLVLLIKDKNGASIMVDDVPAGDHPLGAESYVINVDASNAGPFSVRVSLDNTVTSANVPSDYTLAVTTDGGGSGTTSVAGQVRDPGGNGIQLAYVKITGTGGTTGTSATYSLSPNGDYSIGDGPGTYTLTAQKQDFMAANAGTITIPAQGTTILNITLQPADADGDGLPDSLDAAANDPDADNDGLCDGPNTVSGVCVGGEDLNANGVLDSGESDPALTDTDGDGLTDYEEVITYGTYPDDPDSDNDGYMDDEEIAAGSNPLDQYSVPTTAVPGDVTGDGIVNVADVLVCTRILLGQDTTTDWGPCDVAPLDGSGSPLGDNDLNAGDIGVLQQMVLGM